MLRHATACWSILLTCALLFGPERFAIDEITHTEFRVRLCTTSNEPHVIVEARTYERIVGPNGPEIKVLSEGDGGWAQVADRRLYLTVTPPAATP